MSEGDARRAAETAARTSYGRLIALLAVDFKDIAAAEDALAQAFAAALRVWPKSGIPANPDAWLLTAARNDLLNTVRHRKVQDKAAAELVRHYDELAVTGAGIPDKRLELLFVCAHPAIDAAMRTPLMLQTVLGLDAGRIGSAFLVAPATMGQRLVRLKAKIRDSGLRFAAPQPEELEARLADVLNAIYAAYGAGWDDIANPDAAARGLTGEAIYLARLLATLLPAEPEAKGLAALMLYCEARRPARRDPAGRFVPLAAQDASQWSREMIIEAEGLLTGASRFHRFGRFQCEAAIQSVHVQRPITGRTNHAALRTLYDLLVRHHPEIGVIVARAAAIAEAGEVQLAVDSLAAIPAEQIATYQPYWATLARCLELSGRTDAARSAFEQAIGLSQDQEVRTYLRERSADLSGDR